MPAYTGNHMTTFRQLLRVANPSIDSGLAARVFGKSSLQPLMAILNDANGTAVQVYLAISRLPRDKAEKYRRPLTYLLTTYHGMALGGIILDDLINQPIVQTKAVRYCRTPMPANFNPGPPGVKVLFQPQSAMTDGSIVQYLLHHPDTTNLLLIHLADANSAGMDESFNGRTTREYIVSAMRVARVLQCPTAAMTVGQAGQPPLFPALLAQYRQLPQDLRHVFHDNHAHVCTNQQGLADFLEDRENCVVMGFDGTVCVAANIFGCPERTGGPDTPYKQPVLTFANVVMSRATLVTNGQLAIQTPTFGRAEYGPLALLGPN
jgi:hypothetical protein